MVPGISPKRIEEDHLARYRFATRYVSNKSVLDIACGTGYGTRMLLDGGATCVEGVDISAETISFAQENYGSSRIIYCNGDIRSFNNGNKYDVIVSFETIEHVPDYSCTLSNLYNLLCDGGLLIISSPNRLITSPATFSYKDKPINKFHTHEFSIPELTSILTEHRFTVRSNNIFGQRQQLFFINNFITKLYNYIFNPMFRANVEVQPVKRKAPRYFIIVAEK
jgi:2-polyprenyl-3-methyl-5-hydroxy-6-metoxy-1,4-benzoquinol methylase